MKYYSFYIAPENSIRSEWVLFDIKLPAGTVREAIFLFFIGQRYRYNEKTIGESADTYSYNTSQIMLQVSMIQRVVVYNRLYTPHRGYTEHRFKKILIYSRHAIISMYKLFIKTHFEYPDVFEF